MALVFLFNLKRKVMDRGRGVLCMKVTMAVLLRKKSLSKSERIGGAE